MMGFIDHLQSLLESKAEVIKGVFTLIKLEARLASISFYYLLIILFIVPILAVTSWLAAMLLIGYLIQWSTGGYVLPAIGLILLLNMALLVCAFRSLLVRLKHMSFEKTRACFSNQLSGKQYELRTEALGSHSQSREKNTKRTI